MVTTCILCAMVTILYLALIVALFELSVDDPVEWMDMYIIVNEGIIDIYEMD